MPEILPRSRLLILMIPLTVVLGCDSDERVVQLSRESLQRQAEQNQQMARQTETVAVATKQLVEAEAESQRQSQELHQQLHTERQSVDRQHEDLEKERQRVAAERHHEPIIAETISGIVALLVAALPLIVCWYLVRTLFLSANDDVTAADLVIEQLATQGPLLTACLPSALPAPPEVVRPPVSQDQPRLPSRGNEPRLLQDHDLRVIVVLEGAHDIEFLKRMSRTLSRTDDALPDLAAWESAGILAFVASNGTLIPFPTTFSHSGAVEFHLLDREIPPVTAQRENIVQTLNAWSHCSALLTTKRAIENYIHPDAIREASGLEISFGDLDDVPELVARATFQPSASHSWEALSRRARRRLRDKAKRWLNREAVERMTPERLAERDPDGEVIGWLRTIAELAGVALPVQRSTG